MSHFRLAAKMKTELMGTFTTYLARSQSSSSLLQRAFPWLCYSLFLLSLLCGYTLQNYCSSKNECHKTASSEKLEI